MLDEPNGFVNPHLRVTFGGNEMPEFTMEIPDKYKAPMVAEMMGTFWLSTILEFIKKAGTEESMGIMGPMMERIGVAKAQTLLPMLPPLEKNALGFATWTNSWEEMMGIEGEIVEASPDRVVKINPKCPFANKDSSPVVCDLFECCLKGAGSIIAPGFMFHVTHNPMRGAPYCRWVIERMK